MHLLAFVHGGREIINAEWVSSATAGAAITKEKIITTDENMSAQTLMPSQNHDCLFMCRTGGKTRIGDAADGHNMHVYQLSRVIDQLVLQANHVCSQALHVGKGSAVHTGANACADHRRLDQGLNTIANNRLHQAQLVVTLQTSSVTDGLAMAAFGIACHVDQAPSRKRRQPSTPFNTP